MGTRGSVFLVVLLLLSTGCGGGSPAAPTSPSSPSTPPSGGGTGVAANLDVKSDALGSRDPVAQLSEVIADASASTGSGALTFSIDFGDGTVASTSTARHVYPGAGAFTITATVSDAQGRKATATRAITVKTVSGSWFEAEFVQNAKRVEVRRLTVTGQSGTTIRGVYQVTGAPDRSFSGSMTSPRTVSISIDGGATLQGVLPGRLDDDSETWPLQARGDTVDGETLAFRAVVGTPAAPPPDAELRLSFDTDDPDAWASFDAVTPVRLDGSASRGADLSYFLEFGDGGVATSPVAARVIDPPQVNSSFPSDSGPALTARLTVVDRFGRSDVESQTYHAFGLGEALESWIDTDSIYTTHESLVFRFLGRHGSSYTGQATATGLTVDGSPATATMSGPRSVHLEVTAWGAVFDGTIKMSPGNNAVMTVVESGRRFNGRVWHLRRNSDF